jgi:hypothetical protein
MVSRAPRCLADVLDLVAERLRLGLAAFGEVELRERDGAVGR